MYTPLYDQAYDLVSVVLRPTENSDKIRDIHDPLKQASRSDGYGVSVKYDIPWLRVEHTLVQGILCPGWGYVSP